MTEYVTVPRHILHRAARCLAAGGWRDFAEQIDALIAELPDNARCYSCRIQENEGKEGD